MTAMNSAAVLDWAVAARPLPGESESGDKHLIVATPGGWLLAVCDGLGHGAKAAAASRALLEVLVSHAQEPLVALLQRSHERLRTTRGAAVCLVLIDAAASTLSWIGVGNVEGVLWRSASGRVEYAILRGGIVGFNLPKLQASSLPLYDGDLLVVATDGIREGFAGMLAYQLPPQRLADRILEEYASAADDALVLVARWRSRQEREEQDKT